MIHLSLYCRNTSFLSMRVIRCMMHISHQEYRDILELECIHSFWSQHTEKRNNTISQMRLRSVLKMRISILNTATTEQMGYGIISFFVCFPLMNQIVNYICSGHSIPNKSNADLMTLIVTSTTFNLAIFTFSSSTLIWQS